MNALPRVARIASSIAPSGRNALRRAAPRRWRQGQSRLGQLVDPPTPGRTSDFDGTLVRWGRVGNFFTPRGLSQEAMDEWVNERRQLITDTLGPMYGRRRRARPLEALRHHRPRQLGHDVRLAPQEARPIPHDHPGRASGRAIRSAAADLRQDEFSRVVHRGVQLGHSGQADWGRAGLNPGRGPSRTTGASSCRSDPYYSAGRARRQR